MIDESCFLVNECNHCDCGKFCMRRYKLEHLYDNALITETQRKHIPLLLDDDNRDLEAFKKLAEFEKNIVSFVNEGKNLFIHSTQCGNGKTSWTLRLVQAYFNKIWIKSSTDKCRALFINVPRFLLALKDNISEKSDYIRHIKENVLDADIVVWDEVGTKDLTTFEHENVLNLINARLDAGKSNIYTSNTSLIAGQGQTSELQTSVGDRLFSRITQLSYCIALNGKDKRFLNVKDKDKIDI